MKPKDVKRYNDILKLPRDNVSYGNVWALLNKANQIIICNQKAGEPPTGKVFLTRRRLNRIIKWWEGK